MRQFYEVRVREQVSPRKWVKKSKFYWAKNSGDAAKKYKGRGLVMWVEKMSKERIGKFGGFFTLGDDLLRDFAKGGDGDYVDRILHPKNNPIKNMNRGSYARERKKTTG